MNKQEAIDSLECFRRNTAHILGDNDEKVKTIETCIMLVREAEEAERWISVSERLPHGSCSDLVNVSIHDDSGDTPFDYTSCGWITTDGEYWIVDNEINNHVIAWMPLPEPYKEDKA